MEHLARLHHTFNSWSERKQELMGSVSLKLMVDASGNVVRVEPENSHVNNSSFVKTVIDDVREWKFPKGSSEAAEITIPLLFIPKGMDPEMIVQWERKVRRAPGDGDAPRAAAIAMARRRQSGPKKSPAARRLSQRLRPKPKQKHRSWWSRTAHCRCATIRAIPPTVCARCAKRRS